MRPMRGDGETPQQTLARLDAAVTSSARAAAPDSQASPRRLLQTSDPTQAAKTALGLFVAGSIAVYVFFPHSYLPWSTQTATAHGVVVDLDPASDGMCFPDVHFVVGDATFTATPSWSTDPCPWTMGGPATVRYAPEDPTDVDVLETGILNRLLVVLPVGLLLAALAALALAVVGWCTPYWVWARRKSGVLVRKLLGR